MVKRAAKIPSRRAPLPRVPDEMRQMSEYLLRELQSWPAVTAKPMFGMDALYRGPAIFAVLPRTRAMETAYSVSFKLQRQTPAWKKELASDARIVTPNRDALWISFEVHSERDFADAVLWFGRAYEQARTSSKPGNS